MTPAETTKLKLDIAALKSAIRSGAEEVSYSDKRVRYRSFSEMRRALADMEAELAGIDHSPRRRAFRVITPADKGL